MKKILGIRREDKNKWETRTPLVPAHVSRLVAKGIRVIVQPNPNRCISDSEFARAGAEINEDLSHCDVVLAVKEVPIDKLLPETTYMFFAHVIKGQEHNMPMLEHMLEISDTLIEYERILDEQRRRLVFFGRYAGIAGMIDGLWALGLSLAYKGVENHFIPIRRAFEYGHVDKAKEAVKALAAKWGENFCPPEMSPVIIGLTGYGNVSQGAQEILDCLPCVEIMPEQIAEIVAGGGNGKIYKVVFHEEHMFERIDEEPFELMHYYKHPEKYQSMFEQYVPHLTMLVNCIYWDNRYPRIITKDYLKTLYAEDIPRLQVISDISCDIEGSIEATIQSTTPDHPFYIYDVVSESARFDITGHGPIISAVDNLPCELPTDSSQAFSEALYPFIPEIVNADYSASFEDLELSPPIKGAVIALSGELTPDYEYINRFLHTDEKD